MKVEFVKLNSANVTADNKSDVTRKYDIICNVNIYEANVTNVEAGRVVKDDVEVASFSKYQGGRLNINFNVEDIEEQYAILAVVNDMYNSIVAKANEEIIKFDL